MFSAAAALGRLLGLLCGALAPRGLRDFLSSPAPGRN